MKTREEYIALIASHAGELQNTFGITSLRIFGSVARNEHHEGSDVDVYVEMPPKFFLIVHLKVYLEELLDSPILSGSTNTSIPSYSRKLRKTGLK